MSRRRKIFHGSPRIRARTRSIRTDSLIRACRGNRELAREENNRVRLDETIVGLCVAEASVVAINPCDSLGRRKD